MFEFLKKSSRPTAYEQSLVIKETINGNPTIDTGRAVPLI